MTMSKIYDDPHYEKWLSEQPMRKGNGLSISDTITQDNQKIFMDWLDTCPVVEFRSIDNVQEDSSVWIYTVDFAVVKEEDA
jgi:hypothetical protein